jgi:hypothetical protein
MDDDPFRRDHPKDWELNKDFIFITLAAYGAHVDQVERLGIDDGSFGYYQDGAGNRYYWEAVKLPSANQPHPIATTVTNTINKDNYIIRFTIAVDNFCAVYTAPTTAGAVSAGAPAALVAPIFLPNVTADVTNYTPRPVNWTAGPDTGAAVGFQVSGDLPIALPLYVYILAWSDSVARQGLFVYMEICRASDLSSPVISVLSGAPWSVMFLAPGAAPAAGFNNVAGINAAMAAAAGAGSTWQNPMMLPPAAARAMSFPANQSRGRWMWVRHPDSATFNRGNFARLVPPNLNPDFTGPAAGQGISEYLLFRCLLTR